jgi:drug/metabolite transporter (DMT)-like permease
LASFSYSSSLILLAASLLSVSASQLIVKWRFGEFASGGDAPLTRSQMLWAALSDTWVWMGGFLTILSAVCWYTALTRLPLSYMMPTAALVAPITVISAYFFLREPVTVGQAAAIGVIAFGVAWLSYQQ